MVRCTQNSTVQYSLVPGVLTPGLVNHCGMKGLYVCILHFPCKVFGTVPGLCENFWDEGVECSAVLADGLRHRRDLSRWVR